MDNDKNFMTSAHYCIYLGLVLLALFVVENEYRLPVLVVASAVWFYFANQQKGWQSPLIEWPEELSFLATCYYASLKILKLGAILMFLTAAYRIWGDDFDSLYLWEDGPTIVLVELFLLVAIASVLSLCWSLHDKWAEGCGSTTIASLNPPFTYGHRGFKPWSWMLINGTIILLLVMLGLLYLLEDEPIDINDATTFFVTYLVLALPPQLWLYFHYQEILPQAISHTRKSIAVCEKMSCRNGN